MAKVASPETLGVEVKVVVTDVNSDGCLFVQLDTEEAYSISDLSEKIATTVDLNKPTFNPDLGSQCFALSLADDSWYRAVVLEKSSLKSTVCFVDYGNVESDLPLSRLAPATEEIFRLPYQAVKCQLAGFVPIEENWSPEVVDKLKQFILNQEFSAFFHSLVFLPSSPILDVPCYSVSLYWERGSDTVAAELIGKGFGQPSLVAETVTVSTSKVTTAYCCYVCSPDSVWIQLASRHQVLGEITALLNSGEFSMTNLAPECLYPGVVCCTQFVDDQQFYRSTVLAYPDSDGTMSVLFSDYGNTATVSVANAFVLPHSLVHHPALAVECAIDGISSLEQPGSWTDQVVDKLATLVQDQELQVSFLFQESGGCYHINAKLADGSDVSDVLIQAGLVMHSCATDEHAVIQVENSGPSLEPYQPQSLQVGQQYTVYVTMAESPAVVWCQLAESTDFITELTQRLADKAGNFLPVANAFVNQVCCIQYSQDQAWYRGVVHMLDEQGVAQVLLVDYGNIEEVPVSSLHVLPQDLYFCPPLAVSLSLYGIEPIDGVWKDAALKRFEELYFDAELTCNVVGLDDDGYPAVQLVVAATSQDMASVLVEEGYAVSTVNEQSTPTVTEKSSLSTILSKILPVYPPLSIPTGTKFTVSVTEIISFEQFSCQLLSSLDDLTFLMEKISEHCSSSDAKHVPFVHPGMSVIAPFSVDNRWYRAVMLPPDYIGQWSVQFIDYGNQETVLLNNLMEIEPAFLTLPPQAFVCTLSGSKEKLSGDDSAIEHFSDLVLEKEVECVVRKKRLDGVYVVELFSKGKSIHELIGLASEETTPKKATVSPQHQSSPQHTVSLSTPPMPTRPLSERIKKLLNLQLPMLRVPVNRSISVCVCFVESPAYFSCQLVDQYQALEYLLLEMCEYYSNQSPQNASPVVATPGSFCAAVFSQDKQWYRAVVIGKHPCLDFADVLFIDYGNSDVVPLSSLRQLEPQFKKLPCQSVCCRLLDSGSQDVVLDKQVTAEFMEQPTTIAKPIPCRLRDFEIEVAIAEVASLTLEEDSEQQMTSKSSPEKPVTPKTSPKKQAAANYDSIRISSLQPTVNVPSLATVSYIVSPHEIYCQPLVSCQELIDLMGVLFVYYVEQTKGSCLAGPDMIGSYCAVPYADGSYYRGKILSVVDNCAQVFYIDYGNTDPVPLADISVLDRQFANLPAQAIKCFLSGILSTTPSWSTESIAVLMDTALNQEMNVTYLSKAADGSYGVKILGADNLSLSDLLIMSGMGVKPELPKPSSLSVSPTLLKPGIQEEVVLTAVLPDCHLYCQLLSSEQALSILSDGIIDLISTSQSFSYAADSITTGMLVLAQFTEDDCWYRSRVISNSQDAVQVIFIDYGNTETLPISRLSSISPELCQLPAQAILCKLNSLEKYMATESTSLNMSDVLLNSVLTLKCHKVDEHGLHTVDLKSESLGSVLQHIVDSGFVVSSKDQAAKCTGTNCEPSGATYSKPSTAQTSDLHCIELSRINIQPSSKFEANFSYFETPFKFFCQQTALSTVLENLQVSLSEYYSSTSPSCYTSISDLKTNQFVAAKFSEDGFWYRGEIKAIDLANSTANVLFVDYGNSEWTSLANICPLDAKFATPQIQGIQCALTSVQPSGSEWSSEAIDTIYDLCMAQTVVTIDAGIVNGRTVEVREILDEQGKSILQQFVATGLAKWKNTQSTIQSDAPPASTTTAADLSTQSYPPLTISSGDSELVYISYTESDGTIWVQPDSRVPDLEEINSRIAIVYGSRRESFPFTPVVGAPCCALFTDDEQWYRSTVMAVTKQDVQVLFVDFGNSETFSPDLICSLKPEFSSIAPFAIHCQLSPSSPPLPPNAIEEQFMLQFVNPVADNESMWEVVVSLENGLSKQDIPQPSSTVTVIPELSLCQGQTYSVFIPVAESPDQFWCQLTSQYDTLEALMATVGDFYANNNPPVTVVPGMFCVSQFRDNRAWYRAKILHVQQPDQAEVLYVDYGNRQVVQSAEEICGLDGRFAGIPCQAFCCSLLPSPQAEYPDDKLEAFFSLNFDEDTFHVTLEKFLPSGRWLVSLTDKSGKSINDLFVPSSADTGSLLSSSSIPVSSELSLSYPDLHYYIGATVDVFVTCVVSPSGFYCQPLHLSTDLDQLMEDVANYMATKEEELHQQEIAVGQACLARYSFDRNWYRARIDNFDEESGKFLAKFIDYGNSEYLESVDVTLIPEQFVSTPCQVLHCSVIEEVDHDTSWSDEKKDAFRILVCEEEQYTLRIVSFSPAKHKYVVEVMCDSELLEFPFLGELKTTSAAPTKPGFREGRNSLDLSDIQTSFSGPDLSINSATAIKGSKTPTTDPEESEGESIATGEPLIHAPFKLSLATSEVVDVEVVYVQNPSYICVQRLDCSTALEGLSAEIDQYCDYADKLTQQSYHPGDFVLAQFSDDSVWYRAQVKNVSDDDLYEVQFIDFGNSDFLPPTKLIMCPGNFLDLPVQAIPCSLAQVPNREVWPDIYKQIIDDLVQNKVLKVTVVVAGSHGMPATVIMEDSESGVQVSQKILEQLQVECEDGNLSFDFLTSTELHVPPEINELEEIAEEEEDTLLEENESDGKKEYHTALEATVESLVQRVRTLSMEELEAENLEMACLQDSANNAKASLNTDMLDSVESFPILAVGARVKVRVLTCNGLEEFVCQSLDSSTMQAITQAIEEEDHTFENRELLNSDLPVLAWHEEDKSWYRGLVADVNESLDAVTIILVDLGISKSLPAARVHHINAKIAQIAPPQCFTCQLPSLLEADLDPVFAGTDEELEWPSHCQEYFQEQVKEKDSFLAEIVQKKGGVFVVQLFIVDSGGEILGSIRDNVIARMAQTQNSLDCLNLETTKEDKEEEEDLLTLAKQQQEAVKVQSLGDNGVHWGKVKGQDLSSQSFSTLNILAGQEIKLTICSPFDSDGFICQPTETVDSLEAMMKELQEHMSLPTNIPLTDLKIDQPVVVHKQDGKWYRAQVQNINNDLSEVQVRLVDYGTIETLAASHVSAIPGHFMSLSKQAITCLLREGQELTTDRVPLLTEELRSSSSDWKVVVAKVLSISHSKAAVVLTIDSGQSVSAELIV